LDNFKNDINIHFHPSFILSISLPASQTTMSAHPDPAALARLSLYDPSHFHVQLSQTKHRLDLLERWNIPKGSRVLELGCGQGDCTTVLADAVGEEGKVVALDPADLEYGMSQEHDPFKALSLTIVASPQAVRTLSDKHKDI
jgi:predicted methyltransferase